MVSLNFLTAGPGKQTGAGDGLDLIQHSGGYVKRLHDGIIIRAGNGIRQYGLNLIQKLAFFHAAGKLFSGRACFARAFDKMSDVEIKIVIVCRFV
jgi:hypothetical protein